MAVSPFEFKGYKMTKPDEKLFFERVKNKREDQTVRDIIDEAFDAGEISHVKRAWYILTKWAQKGIYDYGCNIELGWLEKDARLPI